MVFALRLTLLAPALLGSLAMPSAQALTLLVRNNNDSGSGSLRQAIMDNNALGGDNTIVFSNTVTGTIVLSGQLSITASATILGPGANVLTVSANNTGRVLDITGGPVYVSGLTLANGRLTDGYGGAGIENLSTLTLQNCVLANNVNAYPTIGGAIYNGGTVVAVGTTFQTNSALGGGAIYTYAGQVALTNCTFSGNTAAGSTQSRGGAVWADGNTQVLVFGCTIVSNTAAQGGGVAISAGFGSLTIGDSIVAGNHSTSGQGVDAYGNVTSRGYNLVGNTVDSTGWTGVGDQTGSGASPLNPQLFPLGAHGGPTPTMPPMPVANSLVIDQGKSFGAPTDQRGLARTNDFASIPSATLGDNSDIGACEFLLPKLNIVPTSGTTMLLWPTYSAGFRLQSVTNLPPTNWVVVNAVPGVTNDQFFLINETSPGRKFYRLVYP